MYFTVQRGFWLQPLHALQESRNGNHFLPNIFSWTLNEFYWTSVFFSEEKLAFSVHFFCWTFWCCVFISEKQWRSILNRRHETIFKWYVTSFLPEGLLYLFRIHKKVPQDISQCDGTQPTFLTGHYCISCCDPGVSVWVAALPASLSVPSL